MMHEVANGEAGQKEESGTKSIKSPPVPVVWQVFGCVCEYVNHEVSHQ